MSYSLPILIEEDEDGVFVLECPLFEGCYSQGETKEEAMGNIKEVIDMCLEEETNKDILVTYLPQKVSFDTLEYA